MIEPFGVQFVDGALVYHRPNGGLSPRSTAKIASGANQSGYHRGTFDDYCEGATLGITLLRHPALGFCTMILFTVARVLRMCWKLAPRFLLGLGDRDQWQWI